MARDQAQQVLESRVGVIVARLAKRGDPAVLPVDVDIFQHLGIASSAALDLLLTLEEELDVHIPDAVFNEARTIAALAEVVRRAAVESRTLGLHALAG